MLTRRIDQAIDMGLGAGLMYWFDPQLGKQRRKDLQKQAAAQVAMLTVAATQAAFEARQRAVNLIPSAQAAAKLAVFQKLAADEALLARAKDTLKQRGLVPYQSRTRMAPATNIVAVLAAATAGAALMYFFDPEMGAGRRSRFADQLLRRSREAGESWQGTANDMANRARGMAAETRGLGTAEVVPDNVLAERVRANLGHIVANPGSINVSARQGRVTLSGPILAGEVDRLLDRVHSVPGVLAVENRLDVHQEPGHVPGLQGRNS